MNQHPLYMKMFTLKQEELKERVKGLKPLNMPNVHENLSLEKYLVIEVMNNQNLDTKQNKEQFKKFLVNFSIELNKRFDTSYIEVFVSKEIKEVYFALPSSRYTKWDYLSLVKKLKG